MKVSLLPSLVCPNTGLADFTVYAHELERGGQVLCDLSQSELVGSDDVREGFIVNKHSQCAYPIRSFVLSLLNDEDAAGGDFCADLLHAAAHSPPDLRSVVEGSVARIREGAVGERAEWNHGEMEYYDREVSTVEAQKHFLDSIANERLWHIYIERDLHLISHLKRMEPATVLEIGCGNARTIRTLFRPVEYGYRYVGTDISLMRLVVARAAMPEGDFIQCSAFNLPFRNRAFSAITSFGVLHHLPDPLDGVRECARCLAIGGSFFIHEPLERPRLLDKGQWSFVQRLFRTYDHSEHDGTFNLTAAEQAFTDSDLAVKRIHFCGSLPRTIVARVFHATGLQRYEAAWKWLIKLDAIFIRAFCGRTNQYGPKAVLLECLKVTQPEQSAG